MLPPKALGPLISIVLNLLTIHSATSDLASGTSTCPSRPILQCLHDDHDVPSEVASGMMKLFSAPRMAPSSATAAATGVMETADGRDGDTEVEWTADIKAIVRVIGLGELEHLREAMPVDKFEYRWRELVGDWGDLVDVQALAVCPDSSPYAARDVLDHSLLGYRHSDETMSTKAADPCRATTS